MTKQKQPHIMRNMETIEIVFCQICCNKIKSKALSDFWKQVCISSVLRQTWVGFSVYDPLTKRSVEILEKKLFLISVDHHQEIFVKPSGIRPLSSHSFLICLSPKYHIAGKRHIPNNP